MPKTQGGATLFQAVLTTASWRRSTSSCSYMKLYSMNSGRKNVKMAGNQSSMKMYA